MKKKKINFENFLKMANVCLLPLLSPLCHNSSQAIPMGSPEGVPIFKADRLSRGMNKRSVVKLRKLSPVIMNVRNYYQLGRDDAIKTPQFIIGFPITSQECQTVHMPS